MSFPLRIPDQLRQHLRALRQSRGLTQAQLGALVGVRQARIAEIEANPGAVSMDQLTKVLAALGGTLHLHSEGDAKAQRPATTAAAGQAIGKTKGAVKQAPRAGVVIRPKKGAW